MNPGNCLSSDSGKLSIRRDHPASSDRNEILHGGWSSGDSSNIQISSKSIKRFQSCWLLKFALLIYLATGVDKIVISQQIKELIANKHEKLSNL